MKGNILLILCCLLFGCLNGWSQNIVLNGEFTNLAPNGMHLPNEPDLPYPVMLSTHAYPEITKAVGWNFGYALNNDNIIGTVDLFSVASTNLTVDIQPFPDCSAYSNRPCHSFFNSPSSPYELDQNYARITMNVGDGSQMEGESLLGTLNSPLIPGETYYFQCHISSSETSTGNLLVQFRNSTNPNITYVAHTFTNTTSLPQEWSMCCGV